MGSRLVFALLFTLALSCSSFTICADVLYQATSVGTLKGKKSEARSLNQQGAVAGKVWVGENTINDFLWIPEEKKIRYVTTEGHPESFPLLNNKNQVAGILYKEKKESLGKNLTVTINPYIYDPVNGNEERGQETSVGTIIRNPISKWIYSMLPKSFSDLLVVHLKGFNDRGERLFVDASDPSKVVASVAYLQEFPYQIVMKNISSINNNSEMLVVSDGNLLGFYSIYFKQKLVIRDSKNELVKIVANQTLYGIALSDNRHVIAVNEEGNEGFFWSPNDDSDEKLISLGSFIPIALNNHGDVIGKLYSNSDDEDPSFWLRTIDGTMIDLNASVDFGSLNVEKITHMWAINDAGQILISAIVNGSSHALLLNRK